MCLSQHIWARNSLAAFVLIATFVIKKSGILVRLGICSGHGACHFRVIKGCIKKTENLQMVLQAEDVGESVLYTSGKTEMAKSRSTTRT